MTKLNLSTATETQVADTLNAIKAEGVGLQWSRRTLIADLSVAKKWTLAQLKDGAAKTFLDDVDKSASQMSELRSYALPDVRKQVEKIRTEATALADTDVFTAPAATIAGLIVTQIKNGKKLKEAVTKVVSDKAVKNATAAAEDADPEVWLKAQLKSLEAKLKRRFTEDSVVKALSKMDKLKVKVAKEKKPEPTDAPVFDIAGVLDGMDSLPADTREQIAALLNAGKSKKNKKKK